MARCLVAYIACDERVFREVKATFDTSPCLYTIREMRRVGNKVKPTEPMRPHEGYYPQEASAKAAAASKSFLEALERERQRPAAPFEIPAKSLSSTYLTDPVLVNLAYEREAMKARGRL
jgi:hypothetical protein